MKRKLEHYHSYDEVTELLHRWVAAHPKLCSLESIGQCTDGKEIWLMTLTDSATGIHSEKPAFWCDANMHAGEVTGCEAVLHLVETLIMRWDAGDSWTRAVLTRGTVYCVPRISADGAEYNLNTAYSCRSAPVKLDPIDFPGFVADDIDDNGVCLMMRKADPAGMYKCSTHDPRIMVQRLPHERDSSTTYYRMWPEGRYRDYDGFTQRAAPSAPFSLDANRQLPFNFEPEGMQRGAGTIPGHLPQAAALTAAIASRNNICTLMNYHTYGNMVIRPPEEELGADFPAFDALTQLGVYLDIPTV